MASETPADPRRKLSALRKQLVAWLVDAAYPLWARNGIDSRNGGFIETLTQTGAGLPQARRARVHPRQIYAFAQASSLGWTGDVGGIVRRGMDYFLSNYLRPDGLFRTLADVNGASLDDRALLYDQSFALLGFAAAAGALDARAEFETRALDLRRAIDFHLSADEGAFHSDETGRDAGARAAFESNPHMHLLEACLAWAEIGTDAGWTLWASRIAELALKHFIRRGSGALGEAFAADWSPAPGVAGRIIEPGHQFEWAWLLLRCEACHSGNLREAALRLIAIGENSGVYNRVAVNALLDDLSVHDPNARFWPQTERLKAAVLAARLTADGAYWTMAATAAESMVSYLETPVAGLWRDVLLPNGEFIDAPAPASTFYHVVGAIVSLHHAVAEFPP